MSDEQMIFQSAVELLDALTTPIAGEASVEVVNRANALRLIAAAFRAVWESTREQPE